MVERVVVKQGSKTTEFTYGDYQDWNNPLNKIEVFYAGKMVERRNGAVVRDLTTVETETGSVYVVMPVPASVRAAIKVAAAQQPVSPEEPGSRSRAADAAHGQRQTGPDGQLEFQRHELALRESPLRADAADRAVPGPSIRPWISSSKRPRGSDRIVHCTNPSTGTRFSSSTCGPTRKTPS